MERRTFLSFSILSGAALALEGCSDRGTQLIRFIPEEDLVPGVAVWKPSVCALCSAGCGIQVRVMEGEAEVVRNGQFGIVKMGLAKKLAGNPEHPVSRGKLCARGEAGLQVTYNPDRVKHPLKRAGERGSGQFTQVSWDEAIQELLTHLQPLASQHESKLLAFLTSPQRGQRGVLIERFLSGFDGAEWVRFELFDDVVLRRANRLSFGYEQLPTVDLARSGYVISFGADFLGTWNSPVAQSVGYGKMRQNRSGVRGKFVQVESRVSQTGANADEWVAAHPGTEGLLALGIAHVIFKEKLGHAETGAAGTRIDGWREGLPAYSPEAVAWKTGVRPETITRLAREMAARSPAVAMVGGAPLAQTNGLFTALAVNALNALLGSVGKPGGLQFTPEAPLPASVVARENSGDGKGNSVHALAQQILSGQPRPVEVLLLHEANPVFATPLGWRVKEALEKVPFIASFGSFVDETSRLADLILPDHSFLESWIDDVPESGTTQSVVSVAPPAMRPLHDTRALPDVLLDLAHRLGGRTSQVLPWKSYEEMLHTTLAPLAHHPGSINAKDDDEFWNKIQEQGGWWSVEASAAPKAKAATSSFSAVKYQEAEFAGSVGEYPFYFLPYATQQFYDGRHANLPWMQEIPEVLSTGMWGTWVEINPRAAATLQIEQGDLVEVASPHGRVRAPALLSPGIAPDMIAIPVGQGHEEYGRYASGRGANPIKVLAPQVEPTTGALAWAGTRVSITKVGKGELILLSGGPTQWSQEKINR
jgi:anaerobic selenocysteine-containing dehydrogenase